MYKIKLKIEIESTDENKPSSEMTYRSKEVPAKEGRDALRKVIKDASDYVEQDTPFFSHFQE